MGAAQQAQRVGLPRLPRNHGPHRIACFALYRAVLKQCPRVPLPNDLPPQGRVNPLKHLVRKGFRRHTALSSTSLIAKAFEVAHNAEALLRTAGNGSAASISQIHALLEHLESKRQVSLAQPRPIRKEIPRVWPYPDAPKFIDVRPRPREQLTGRRHVPHLAETNGGAGFAFLRPGKPQSPFLSRVMRNKGEQKIKNLEYSLAIEEDIPLTDAEQQWEKLIVEQIMEEVPEQEEDDSWLYGEGKDWADGHSWTSDLMRVKDELTDVGMQRKFRAKQHGERLVAIWEEEKELRSAEKIEGKREKKALKRARRDGSIPEEASRLGQDHQHKYEPYDLGDGKEPQEPADSPSQSAGDGESVPEDEVQATLPPKLVKFTSMRPEEQSS